MATQTAASARSWSYVAWWVGLLFLHVANTLYYLGFTAFYKFLPGKNLAFQLKTYSIGIAQTEYGGIAATHAAVFTVHALYVVLMIGSSVAARRFVFSPSVVVASMINTVVIFFQRRIRRRTSPAQTRHQASRFSSLPQLVIRSASRTVDFVFGRKGLLGVDGVYFDDLLVIQEIFETALQSYQAYRMTQLLPRLGLIRVYVMLLVANCWSVPILHRVYRDQDQKRRMASLLCDAVLDTISSMGITLLIFASYAPQYTDARFGFPFSNWFNDEWFTAVHQEFQMMLVVSWGDMASRVVFALGLLQCMDAVKDMLETEPIMNAEKTCDAVNAVVPSPPKQTPGPVPALTRHSHSNVCFHRVRRLKCVKQFVLHTVAPTCFVVWGFVIIIVHAYAEYRATTWPCALALRPWLRSQPACSLLEVDCYALGASGSVASLSEAWTRFDPSLTAHLAIRHCPELVIPPVIARFHYLTTLKVYNSTIASWPETAPISAASHSALRALYFVRTIFVNATLPAGLMTANFPPTVRSFIVSSSNLGSLPANLHQVWPQRMSVAFEYSQFTAIPDVIMRLKPALISFSQTHITSIPASLFEIPTLANLLLCYSLVQELPRNVTKPSPKLYVLILEGNNISTLWSWMDPIMARSLTFNKRFFNLHDTPFCTERQQIEAGTRTSFAASEKLPASALARAMDVSTPERLAFSQTQVACELDMISFFPLALEDLASAIAT